MRTLRNCLILAGLALAYPVQAPGHDWYPVECCHALDCAPVTSTAMVAGATYEHGEHTQGLPMLVVTTKMGTAIVPPNFPRRESKDNQMHACMRPGEHGMQQIICIFMPPGM